MNKRLGALIPRGGRGDLLMPENRIELGTSAGGVVVIVPGVWQVTLSAIEARRLAKLLMSKAADWEDGKR